MTRTLSFTLAVTSLLCQGARAQEDPGAERLMEARFAMVAEDLRVHAGATRDQLDELELAFHGECDVLSIDVGTVHRLTGRPYAQVVLKRLRQSEAWSTALGEHLSTEQRAAYHALGVARRRALAEAQARQLTVTLAAELRLREPQVKKLEALAKAFVPKHGLDSSEQEPGSAALAWLEDPALHGWLLPSQVERSARMRSDAAGSRRRASADRDRKNGAFKFKDPGPGKGRFIEDDFGFELDALTMFYGWDEDSTALLADLAVRLGRDEDAKQGEHPRRGSPALFKSLVNPSEKSLWRGLLSGLLSARLDAADSAAVGPDPGPYFDTFQYSTKKAFVAARTELVLRWLALRASLQEDQLPRVRAALEPFVEREYLARGDVFGVIEGPAIWRQLSMVEGRNPRKGSNSRTRLAERLTDVLRPAQEIELGLWVEGMEDMGEGER